jgi:hypothetical protein
MSKALMLLVIFVSAVCWDCATDRVNVVIDRTLDRIPDEYVIVYGRYHEAYLQKRPTTLEEIKWRKEKR